MLFLFGTPVLSGDSESPTSVVKGTVDEVVRIVTDEKLKTSENSAYRRRLLEKVIGHRFDYREMAKRSLAGEWKKRSGEEQEEFVGLFQSFLSHNYAGKIEEYAAEQPVQYIKARVKGSFAEVQTKIPSKGGAISLDYRLLRKSGKWRAYNVVVNGVSLVRNYRTQFKRIIRSSSYTELVKKLSQKSKELVGP